MGNAESKVGNGRQEEGQKRRRRERIERTNERTNERAYTTPNEKRSATRVDILIVMNRPRYRGAIRAFRPLPSPLRAEFVSHTTRRQNSRGNSDEMFLLPIITHGEAEGSEGEASERAGESTMMR